MQTVATRIMSVSFAALILAGCAGEPGPKTGAGVATGAFTGAVIGAATGRGPGAALAGAVIGGVVGGSIGNALDEQDRRRAYEAEMRALEYGGPWRSREMGWRSWGLWNGRSRTRLSASQLQSLPPIHAYNLYSGPSRGRARRCLPQSGWQLVEDQLIDRRRARAGKISLTSLNSLLIRPLLCSPEVIAFGRSYDGRQLDSRAIAAVSARNESRRARDAAARA